MLELGRELCTIVPNKSTILAEWKSNIKHQTLWKWENISVLKKDHKLKRKYIIFRLKSEHTVSVAILLKNRYQWHESISPI